MGTVNHVQQGEGGELMPLLFPRATFCTGCGFRSGSRTGQWNAPTFCVKSFGSIGRISLNNGKIRLWNRAEGKPRLAPEPTGNSSSSTNLIHGQPVTGLLEKIPYVKDLQCQPRLHCNLPRDTAQIWRCLTTPVGVPEAVSDSAKALPRCPWRVGVPQQCPTETRSALGQLGGLHW